MDIYDIAKSNLPDEEKALLIMNKLGQDLVSLRDQASDLNKEVEDLGHNQNQ